jgi:hypothetical protein
MLGRRPSGGNEALLDHWRLIAYMTGFRGLGGLPGLPGFSVES